MIPNVDPTEPEVLEIAMAFLQGYSAELAHQNEIIQSLETEESRQDRQPSHRETLRRELEDNKPYMAIAVGVAAAIKFALSNQANTPTDV